MRKTLLFSAISACILTMQAETAEIRVYNPGNIERDGELVEVDESSVKRRLGSPFFILRDASGEEVPWQKTHDGKIIFPVKIAPLDSAVYVAEPGVPSVVEPRVYGRLFRERADDMTWENERAAYRAYGPGQQRNGDRTFGYDLWTKSVPELVLEKRYIMNNRKGLTFHRDHGNGMDVYAVGPTLGGGTAALLDADGSIIYPWCFSDYEILEQGPLRFQVRLIYPVGTAEKGLPVAEERIITLDAGDWLNRTEVTYYGLTDKCPVVAGQVVHKQNPDAYVLDTENGFAAYADLTEDANAGNGVIFAGMVAESDAKPLYLPLDKPAGDAVGHVVLRGEVENNRPFVYHWGAGWSKGGMPTMDEWKEVLRHKRECVKNPMRVKVTDGVKVK